MRRILLVGGGRHLQSELRRLHPELTTVVLCRASGVGLVPELGANDFVGVLPDGASVETWVQAARAVRSTWPFERVTALAEIDQDKAAAVASALGLPYHPVELVEVVNDKHRMRQVLAASGLTRVRSVTPGSPDAAVTAADELGLPLVVKPNGGRGSAGVTVVRDRDQVADAFEHARRWGADVGEHGACLEVTPPMLEQFVDGPEYSIECFTVDGRHHVAAVTEKFVDETTHVELGHVVPARLGADEHERVVTYVESVLTALGVRSGVTHTEVIVGPGGPEIVETHLRKAGDEILELVRDCTGWDLDEATVLQSGGSDVPLPPWPAGSARRGEHYDGAAAIWFAAADRHGTLIGVDGIDRVTAAPGVRDARQLVPAGATVEPLSSSLSRVVRVRVVADDADTAISRAAEHVRSLEVRVAAAAGAS
jgi:biotin carboxylase